MKKILIKYIFSILLIIFLTKLSTSCSCLEQKTTEQELNGATTVFSGKAINITIDGQSEFSNYIIIFEVEKTWKGIQEKIITISTPTDEGLCGYNFQMNEKYLVYALGDKNYLNTNLCTRTKLLSNAQQDIEKLGQGTIRNSIQKQKNIFQKILEWIKSLFSWILTNL